MIIYLKMGKQEKLELMVEVPAGKAHLMRKIEGRKVIVKDSEHGSVEGKNLGPVLGKGYQMKVGKEILNLEYDHMESATLLHPKHGDYKTLSDYLPAA